MIRFANPGSDISSLTRMYQVIFEELQGNQPFSLDDMSAALVRRNLATSCGYAGDEALSRSNRADRSRDPLYNQSKMYSELFRLLGWLHPTASRLSFVLTWLGAHVAAAGPHSKPLVRECVLGIALPNGVVATKGDYRQRPFSLILRTMDELGGLLCRDEMILGPLSLDDDTKAVKVRTMTEKLASLRGENARHLDAAITSLAREHAMQVNTLENYTRFPLAVLESSGWTEKIRNTGVYGRPIVFHRLTRLGRHQVEIIKQAQDLRVAMLDGAKPTVREAAAKLGAFSMLERAGFDASALTRQRSAWVKALVAASLLRSTSSLLIYSPFQESSPKDVSEVFGGVGTISATPVTPARVAPAVTSLGRAPAVRTTVRLAEKTASSVAPASGGSLVEGVLRTALGAGATVDRAADQVVTAFEGADKSDFYPAVSSLFRLLGYDCSTSRVGVNYQRWDAFITHPTDSVPLEIKSPGEERFISVKGVRQALENKIILLARQAAPTQRHTTALVVGFLPPNDRAEVADLISDIHRAFGITIGVIDFRSLALMAAGALTGSQHDVQALLSLKGFIDVAPA
jgi:hypothetical protein